MNGEVPGSFTPQELAVLPDFGMTTLVCPSEGEILEKNWRRSGEFPDIIPHLQEKEKKQAPPPPAPRAQAPQSLDIDTLIDSASTRLFGHVADLMKELENQREEKALVVSLQNQLGELRPRLLSLEAALKDREETISGLRIELEKSRNDLSGAKRSLTETADDLGIRNRLVEKISRDLTEKELSLAKSLTVIRRLEESLARLRPDAAVPAPVEPAAVAPPAPPLPEPALTEQPAAHNALLDFLKRFTSQDSH
jgi:hypothetical protein